MPQPRREQAPNYLENCPPITPAGQVALARRGWALAGDAVQGYKCRVKNLPSVARRTVPLDKPTHPDAVIFDFDGVIVDSEPIHLQCFAETLGPLGIALTARDYYAKYLGFDDHDCYATVLQDNGREADEAMIAELIVRKCGLTKQMYRQSVPVIPGAVALVGTLDAAGVPLAICSGAMREEIDLAAGRLGVLDRFTVVVAQKDVARGKPDPEGYVRALEQLRSGHAGPIRPACCVAIEDTAAGVQSARAAGVKVLALTGSSPAEELAAADAVVDSLGEVDLPRLSRLLYTW